jgi:tripartite-type tricarboxylate transporter receptor subunit TctC
MDGVYAPAKTPRPIIERLNREIVRVITMPEVKEKFFGFGLEVVGGTPEQLAAAVRAEIALWSRVIKEAGISAN